MALLIKFTLICMEGAIDVSVQINKFFDAVGKLGDLNQDVNPDFLSVLLLLNIVCDTV